MTIHRKQPKTVTSVSTPRWLGYATAAAATVALGHAETAMAAVDVFMENIPFAAPSNATVRGTFALGTGGAYFRLVQRNHGSVGGSAGARSYHGGSLRGFKANGFTYASKLALGEAIKGGNFVSSGILASFSAPKSSQWRTPGTGYLGFEFTDAGGLETGWAEITMDSGEPENTFTLDEYAYSTAGELLTAGEVPEPGSLAWLALGGAGLLAWRKRRALAAATPALSA